MRARTVRNGKVVTPFERTSAPVTIADRAVATLERFAAAPVGCGTCSGVRKAVAGTAVRVIKAVSRSR